MSVEDDGVGVPGGAVPTNRALAAEADALGKELGVAVATAGLNKAALLELVESLRSQAAARAGAAAGDSDAAGATDAATSAGAGASAAREDHDAREREYLIRCIRGALDTPVDHVPHESRVHAAAELRGMMAEVQRIAPHELEVLALAESFVQKLERRPGTAYRVARGHSITSRRGILGPGERVEPRDISGDSAERLERLAAAGVLDRIEE